MNLLPTRKRSPDANRAQRIGQRGFTLAEVLAAMAFMAIVIPTAVEGLRVATMAGEAGQRKSVAARIADRMLTEWTTTSASLNRGQNGVVQEGGQQYRWTVRSQTWPQDTMRLLTVDVAFQVQGRELDVRMSTLTDPSSR